MQRAVTEWRAVEAKEGFPPHVAQTSPLSVLSRNFLLAPQTGHGLDSPTTVGAETQQSGFLFRERGLVKPGHCRLWPRDAMRLAALTVVGQLSRSSLKAGQGTPHTSFPLVPYGSKPFRSILNSCLKKLSNKKIWGLYA